MNILQVFLFYISPAKMKQAVKYPKKFL